MGRLLVLSMLLLTVLIHFHIRFASQTPGA